MTTDWQRATNPKALTGKVRSQRSGDVWGRVRRSASGERRPLRPVSPLRRAEAGPGRRAHLGLPQPELLVSEHPVLVHLGRRLVLGLLYPFQFSWSSTVA